MSDFSNLSTYETKGRLFKHLLPIRGVVVDKGLPTEREVQPYLMLRHAGDSNKGWANAVAKANMKTGLARKAMQGRRDVNQIALERDLELYPVHIIAGWGGIPKSDGSEAVFSQGECAKFLEALPTWIFDSVRLDATTALNFVGDDSPDAEDVEETAGN